MNKTTNSDELYMSRCLTLAKLGSTWVAPNPMVGCVIVWNDMIIGEGYHEKFGGNHAEINAIQNVKIEDRSKINEATLYVNLEPCSHFGKTPPCADSIIKYAFKKVIIGCIDLSSHVCGKGINKLKEAGIDVVIGILENECIDLNKRFFTFQAKKRPYITLKWAQTKDNFIDQLRDNASQKGIFWISNPETQSLVHLWRSEEHAILVGWKTVNNDNPSLNVRKLNGKNPIRVILDSNLKSDKQSTVFTDDGEKTIVLNKLKNEVIHNTKYIQLDNITTKTILEALHKEGILSVLVEGGRETLQHFIDDQVWDETKIIVSESMLNQGLKAPVISGVPTHSYNYSTDTIFTYKNR